MIRLIALDLDGTALNPAGVFSARTRRALERASSRGIQVVAASGRPFRSLPDCLWQVKGLEYVICSNGAAVYRLPDRTCLRRSCLAPEQVLALLDWMEAYPAALEGAVEGEAYADQSYVEDPTAFGAPEAAVPYIRRTRRPVPDIRAFLRENRERLDAVDIVTPDPAFKQTVQEELSRWEGLYVTSSVPHLVELASGEAGKAPALAWLAGQLSLHRSEMIAFGNAENDMDMLRFAGTGVAMGNSPDPVKQAADLVTSDNAHDGVAEVLERYGI